MSLFGSQLVQLYLANEHWFGKFVNDLLLAKSSGHILDFILLKFFVTFYTVENSFLEPISLPSEVDTNVS